MPNENVCWHYVTANGAPACIIKLRIKVPNSYKTFIESVPEYKFFPDCRGCEFKTFNDDYLKPDR